MSTLPPIPSSISWPSRSEERVERLKRALPPAWWQLLRRVIAEAEARRLPLYLVGGFVRDLLLGRPNHDFDLVVEGDAVAFAHTLATRYGGRVTVHRRFGTASWHPADSLPATEAPPYLDFVTARSEIYPRPGALPTVTPGSIADDLRRRDFTINALAIRLDGQYFGELRDDFGGLSDLQQGRIRTLHPLSYRDDPTRILRAVRYEQRYAFHIATEDLQRIAEARSGLRALSGERLRHEFDLILEETQTANMLARLEALGILAEIHPTLFWDESLRESLERLQEDSPPVSWKIPDLRGVPRKRALAYLLWLGRRSEAEIRSLALRLDFSAPLRDALIALSTLWREIPGLLPNRPSILTARFDSVPPLALYAILLQLRSSPLSSTSQEYLVEAIEHYFTRWRNLRPRSTGHTLQRLGVPPGPAYQAILWRLRAAWLDGEIRRPAEEKTLLRTLLRDCQGATTDESATLP